jgi:hypothetical protein
MEVQRPEPNGLVIARVSLSLFFENNPMHSSCQLLFFCWQRNAFGTYFKDREENDEQGKLD